MSDSDLSDAMSPTPPDLTLEKPLRHEVVKRFKDGTQGAMTLNQIRQAAEKKLHLDNGFYVGHAKWKAESKRIVLDEMEKQNAGMLSSPTVAADTSPAKPPLLSKHSQPSRALKRSSPNDDDRAKKRSKMSEVASDSEGQLSSPPSEIDEDEAKKKPKPRPAPKKAATKAKPMDRSVATPGGVPESPVSDSQDLDSESMHGKASNSKPDDSESETSIVVDEGPKPKRRKRKSSEGAAAGMKKSKASKSKADADIDPDEAEIKRLQGWLVKCGIRKMWWKELKSYESSKAKIKHLKDMLSDVGMTGRYSIEKATQIREERELAADIEAVKEGAERWGKDKDGSENDGEDKSKRRLIRGAKNYDFLSSDGEETD